MIPVQLFSADGCKLEAYFTGIPQKNRAVAEQYFDEHVSHNDYYTQGEVQPGQWIGEGVERLGLREGGHVNREQFLALCDNTNPETGKLLTQRRMADGERRVFFDFTCFPNRFPSWPSR